MHLRSASLFLCILLGLSPSLVFAAPPNDLLADRDLTDASSLSLSQIQSFLNQKGTLGYYYTPDVDGVVKTAAEVIWRVATTYSISPKFLLALVQREQSLVEAKKPTQGQYDWAAGFGVCDSCSKNDPNTIAWKGFANQIEGAARQISVRYLPDLKKKGTTISGIGPGITKVIDGTSVTPTNKATAILYTYTPHLHGNQNFFTIWQRWFGLTYPDGSLVRVAGSKDIWLLANGEKQKFSTKTAFLSRFSDKDVLPISQGDLDQYADGTPIKFSNYSLLSSTAGDTYLIVNEEKRKIVSKAAFRQLGFNPDEVEPATDVELANYTDSEPLDVTSSYPEGALLQDKKTGGVYFAENGKKYPIWSKELLTARFPKMTITKASADQLSQLETAEPVKFRDGQLIGVKGTPAVYVIEHGNRRPIQNEDVFIRFGWQWNNVIWTSEQVVNLHTLGDPITSPQQTLDIASN